MVLTDLVILLCHDYPLLRGTHLVLKIASRLLLRVNKKTGASELTSHLSNIPHSVAQSGAKLGLFIACFPRVNFSPSSPFLQMSQPLVHVVDMGWDHVFWQSTAVDECAV